jgi:hypothetical protein
MFGFVINQWFSGIHLLLEDCNFHALYPTLSMSRYSGKWHHAISIAPIKKTVSHVTTLLGAALDIFQRCYQARIPEGSAKH